MNKSINIDMRNCNTNAKNIFYIYFLLDKNSQPFYIGKGTSDRYCDHFLQSSLRKKTLKNQIILEIKQETNEWPRVQIYKDKLTEKQAFKIERKLIKKYGRINNNTGILTNLREGGKGSGVVGYKHTQDAKQKIGAALKGRKKHITWGNNISKALKGKRLSPLHRLKLSIINGNRLKGKTLVELYGDEIANKMYKVQKQNLMQKGMTWEERYGNELAEKMRQKAAQKRGKTWEQLYGVEGAKKRREAFKLRKLQKQ